MIAMPQLRDVSTDQQDQGLSATLVIDRDTAARLGISAAAIDNVLYDAFGQREVSTMYTGLNQYFVVMEVDPRYQLGPDSLNGIYIKANPPAATAASTTAVPAIAAGATVPSVTSPTAAPLAASTSTAPAASISGAGSGPMIPLSAIAHYESRRTSLQVNHQGQYPAVTLTFNLAPNVALGDAVTALEKAQAELGIPLASPCHLPGHRPGLPGFPQERAHPHPRRPRRRLHRPRHPL